MSKRIELSYTGRLGAMQMRDDVTMLRKILSLSFVAIALLCAGCARDTSVKTPVPPAPQNNLAPR